jgi:hypothetical protein
VAAVEGRQSTFFLAHNFLLFLSETFMVNESTFTTQSERGELAHGS